MQIHRDEQEHTLSLFSMADLKITLHSFSAHCRTVGKDWSYPLHDHPMFEFNLVLEGRQTINLNGTDLPMEPGDLLLMKPGEKHESRVAGVAEMMYSSIHFEVDEPMLRQALGSIREPLHRRGSPLADAVAPVLGQISEWGASGGPFYAEDRLEIMQLSCELLGALCRLLRNPPADLLGQPRGATGLAAAIAQRIEQAVREQPSMDDAVFVKQGVAYIAKELGYSPAHCNKVFKSVFGLSPRHFLSTLKLRQAKLLLLNREMSVERIAEKLGYRDVSQFSKQFKRWMNISPSQYRQLRE
ncbi:MAG: AraC family transcriptional regulator [Paenibacillaceae bacterium]|jgi:AraC-like DNA-binding protein|nr:AraC family transcriptional regulator [Paenibacillaceae bacterium]